ncbi:hypothetical protein ACFFHJ_29715 [Planotetraspora thailandica]|nr:hypothetical protein [Planotetraspora thailandica]
MSADIWAATRSPGPRRAARFAAALFTAICTAVCAACGVAPTGVMDAGPAPVARGASAVSRIYLVREGRLHLTTVPIGSQYVNDLITALFEARDMPAEGLTTELDGLELTQVQLVRDPSSRNDPGVSPSLLVRVFVSGGKIPTPAMAQITCTARLRSEVWGVEIAHGAPGSARSLQIHTCREYWDLAPRDGRLPP